MQADQISFSIVIPVYNRPGEVEELLQSLTEQTYQKFEVVIVEDGSKETSEEVVEKFRQTLHISYYYKENTGPGDSRNYGMRKALGYYYIIFDSDCIIPPHYMAEVKRELTLEFVHCFGGPDAAHESFSDLQKAINYTMTSALTTGGIRGRRGSVTRFQPRSFNMGLSKEVFDKTGGFGRIHPGEDPDLSLRIWKLGYDTRLFDKAYVYHKRRISFSKFFKQVYKFGKVRPILNKWHPGSSKIVYWFPGMFLLFILCSIGFTFVIGMGALLPLLLYLFFLFGDAYFQSRSLDVAALAVVAVLIQFSGYGLGFFQSSFYITLLGREPEETFPELFFEEV